MSDLVNKYETALADMKAKYEGFYPMPQTSQLIALLTIIRNKNTAQEDFVFYSNRIIRMLIEHALNCLPFEPEDIITPTDQVYSGLRFSSKICGVSVVRAGESMEAALRAVCQGCRIGKILIQRDEKTHEAQLYWEKLPVDIAERFVLLLEPMLASGGSAKRAVEVLKAAGVKEERIVMVNLFSAPEGVKSLLDAFPKIRLAVAALDKGLSKDAFILEGCGDFGDRYFGTDIYTTKTG